MVAWYVIPNVQLTVFGVYRQFATDEILHHFETMGSHCRLVFFALGNQIIPLSSVVRDSRSSRRHLQYLSEATLGVDSNHAFQASFFQNKIRGFSQRHLSTPQHKYAPGGFLFFGFWAGFPGCFPRSHGCHVPPRKAAKAAGLPAPRVASAAAKAAAQQAAEQAADKEVTPQRPGEGQGVASVRSLSSWAFGPFWWQLTEMDFSDLFGFGPFEWQRTEHGLLWTQKFLGKNLVSCW